MAEDGEQPALRARTVFLDDFVDVRRPLDAVRARFGCDGTWLAPLAARATDEGDTLFKVGPGTAAGFGGMEVRIELGECTSRNDVSFVPIRWQANRFARLFPVLDGNMELTPLDAGSCRLEIRASYRPPLDGVGRLIDSAVLHRVAQSTVRSFLVQVARSLETDEEPDS